jgi:hypothetical protein
MKSHVYAVCLVAAAMMGVPARAHSSHVQPTQQDIIDYNRNFLIENASFNWQGTYSCNPGVHKASEIKKNKIPVWEANIKIFGSLSTGLRNFNVTLSKGDEKTLMMNNIDLSGVSQKSRILQNYSGLARAVEFAIGTACLFDPTNIPAQAGLVYINRSTGAPFQSIIYDAPGAPTEYGFSARPLTPRLAQ